MIRLACLAAALAASAPALAGDARLVTRAYDPDAVVRVEGKAGVQATIAFAEDEHIENVAIGDSNSWQVTPNKRANLLFVKPLSASARTNMTVVTDQRSYYFDLVASTSSSPLYLLRFSYKDDKPKAKQSAAALTLTDAEKGLVDGRGDADLRDPAALNFAWRSKGSKAVLPERVYDDGSSTFLSWPERAALPAILIRNAKGEEGPVNYAVRGTVIVIDGVPERLVLRAGRESATLEPVPGAVRQAPPPEAPAAALAAVATPSSEGP